MKLRQMAVAFLFNDKQEVLFLQKKTDSSFLAGRKVPIGGHMEEAEINKPYHACIREIKEETGLVEEQLNHLRLRYIVHRIRNNSEIRTQYVYFGSVSDHTGLLESDEGKLCWVAGQDIVHQAVTATTKEIMKHYTEIGKSTDKVYTGSMKSLNGAPAITWAELEDWEK
ncbi:NUDIX domain-containing protein [Oceanobacillus jeddahense]|uniref:NUDIX domain-containing protein n=1 Tax=Oceanobacillus jeddahense TaxID=1462527 RepID=A0ABY5JSS4_9BACI|nr:NUDIX domain-containing protein [Oceanobacillus jeddahense]UUI03330.1 NUDIX domain-containing protein [Oceanobacillus jeddahense]